MAHLYLYNSVYTCYDTYVWLVRIDRDIFVRDDIDQQGHLRSTGQ